MRMYLISHNQHLQTAHLVSPPPPGTTNEKKTGVISIPGQDKDVAGGENRGEIRDEACLDI